jgi:hypothetical protein
MRRERFWTTSARGTHGTWYFPGGAFICFSSSTHSTPDEGTPEHMSIHWLASALNQIIGKETYIIVMMVLNETVSLDPDENCEL